MYLFGKLSRRQRHRVISLFPTQRVRTCDMDKYRGMIKEG